MVDLDIKGKKAVVFGVADKNSVAWNIVEKLQEQGVEVALAYQERNSETVKPLVKKLSGNSFAKICDVTNDSLLEEFFNEVKENFKKIDFLIHSIAFAKKEFLQDKFMDIDKKGYMKSHEVSSYSLVELTKRAKPLMNKEGSIIAMSFLGSLRVSENYNIMGVCKAALEASVRYLAKDLGSGEEQESKKIRVNAVSFSPIATKAVSGIKDFDKSLEKHKKSSLLKRNISQEDVANAVLFLCSKLSRNITGQTIYVDAGASVRSY